MRVSLLVVALALPACPVPVPTPPPSPPASGYDCENPPALAGVVAVQDAIEGRYIVVLRREGVAAPSIAAIRAEVQAFAAKFEALSEVRTFPTVRAFSVIASAATAAKVAADPGVAYVQADGTKSIRATWGQDRIDQHDLPLDGVYAPGSDGVGVHAVIIDTGIDTAHSEFQGRLGDCHGGRFFGGCQDMHDHGTHVAGTVAGATFGVAQRATLHAARALDQNGSGTDSDVIAAIDFATQLKQQHPDWQVVANMSLGGGAAPALDAAVCASIDAGVVHVVAAGNESTDACTKSPARVRQAVTLGASNDRDFGAGFSNQGQCVDLWAPGVDVQSARRGGGSVVFSGTSMASPHAAGGAVLVLQRHPGLRPGDVKNWLVSNATTGKLGSIGASQNLLLYVKEEIP